MSIAKLAEDLKKGEEKKDTKKHNTGVQSDFFNGIKNKLKAKDYNNKSNTYIDTEISEVLSIIKTRGKIPIASLLSYIVEDWINKNQEHINNLPTNKYLK